MRLRRRLERLEDDIPGPDKYQERRREQSAALHREIDRHRRVAAGEDPGPEPETNLEDERRVIEHVIPRYRFATGWQSEEAREFLDSWERLARERIAERSKA